jgi:hypothetical protein
MTTQLTDRNKRILDLDAAGVSEREIAREVGATPKAVHHVRYFHRRVKTTREVTERRQRVLTAALDQADPAAIAATTGLPLDKVEHDLRNLRDFAKVGSLA